MKAPNTKGQVVGRLIVIGFAIWIAASIDRATWRFVCGDFPFVYLF